jgi:cytosine deaminase
MDLIVRNAHLVNRLDEGLLDIAVEGGRIAAIGHDLAAEGEAYDAEGRLVCGGLIESHIHLDKSRIADRCPLPEGRRVNPVTMVAPLKPGWTVEDVYGRA